MTSPGDSFRVDRLSRVIGQIRDLAKRADKAGVKHQFLKALTESVRELQADPLSFVDPVYNTRQESGVVCRGIQDILVIHCVVYQTKKVVVVLDILPMPRSALEP